MKNHFVTKFTDKYEPFDGHEKAAAAWNRREGEQE